MPKDLISPEVVHCTWKQLGSECRTLQTQMSTAVQSEEWDLHLTNDWCDCSQRHYDGKLRKVCFSSFLPTPVSFKTFDWIVLLSADIKLGSKDDSDGYACIGENCMMILHSFVLTKYHHVTDRWTEKLLTAKKCCAAHQKARRWLAKLHYMMCNEVHCLIDKF